MKIQNFLESSLLAAKFIGNQVVNWGTRSVVLLQAHPLTVVVTCLALVALGTIGYLFIRLKVTENQNQQLKAHIEENKNAFFNELLKLQDQIVQIAKIQKEESENISTVHGTFNVVQGRIISSVTKLNESIKILEECNKDRLRKEISELDINPLLDEPFPDNSKNMKAKSQGVHASIEAASAELRTRSPTKTKIPTMEISRHSLETINEDA